MNLYPYNPKNKNSLYRTDCDNRLKKSKSRMPVCPSENNEINILKCDQNNNSKSCPVLLCNYKKYAQENSKIFERNFSPEASIPIKPMRGGYTRCHQYIDLDSTNSDLYLDLNKKILPGKIIKNKYIPGKGSGIEFLKHIDVDSELRNLRIKNTNCPKKKYIPNTECHYNKTDSNIDLLTKPYCQNYKSLAFDDSTQIYKSTCGKKIQKVDKIVSYNQISDIHIPCKSNVNLNYTNCNYKSKVTGPNCSNYQNNFKTCDNVTDWKSQPLLYGQNKDINGYDNLQIGPNRTNHKCENLWNNVSKRKYINDK